MGNFVKRLIILGGLVGLLTTGCAHQKSSTPFTTPLPEAGHRQMMEPPLLAAADRADSDEEISDEFTDDDLDFLDELETEEAETASQRAVVWDPLYGWNKAMFKFNDKFYFWFAKPVAQGYKAVMPWEIRTCLRNFFFNIFAPVRITNCLLQGEFERGGAEFGRFFINSTVGLVGLADPAKNFPALNPPTEDMGLTLGVYGIGNGPYLVLPFLGPSTVRDAVGMFTDRLLLNPFSYVDTLELSLGLTATNYLNETSFQMGEYEAFKDSAIEPYEAMRDFYIQYRHKKLND